MPGTADFVVAVPSYRRASTLAGKTLPLLLGRGVPPDRVHVYVTADDAASYRSVVAGTGVHLHPDAPAGMGAVRNHVCGSWPAGTRLVCADDDLADVRQRVSDREHVPVPDLSALFAEAFALADQAGLALWGVYPVLNPLFMRTRASTDLRYIVGCLWGTTLRGDPATERVSLDDKEDYERTLRYYRRDGGVLRVGWVAPQTNYYDEPGGMQVARNAGRVYASAVTLARRYPELCALNFRKKSGHPELRLRDRRKVTAT